MVLERLIRPIIRDGRPCLYQLFIGLLEFGATQKRIEVDIDLFYVFVAV